MSWVGCTLCFIPYPSVAAALPLFYRVSHSKVDKVILLLWGYKFLFFESYAHVQNWISKNENVYPHQSRISLPTLLWVTQYKVGSYCLQSLKIPAPALHSFPNIKYGIVKDLWLGSPKVKTVVEFQEHSSFQLSCCSYCIYAYVYYILRVSFGNDCFRNTAPVLEGGLPSPTWSLIKNHKNIMA